MNVGNDDIEAKLSSLSLQTPSPLQKKPVTFTSPLLRKPTNYRQTFDLDGDKDAIQSDPVNTSTITASIEKISTKSALPYSSYISTLRSQRLISPFSENILTPIGGAFKKQSESFSISRQLLSQKPILQPSEIDQLMNNSDLQECMKLQNSQTGIRTLFQTKLYD